MEHLRESLIVLLGLPLVALLSGASLRWAPRDHLVVVSRRGVVRRVASGGPTWHWPLLEEVTALPVDPGPCAVSVRATTRDGHGIRLLAETALPVAPPLPGESVGELEQARMRAEEALADELAAAVAALDVADLGRLEVRGLTVVGLDAVLR